MYLYLCGITSLRLKWERIENRLYMSVCLSFSAFFLVCLSPSLSFFFLSQSIWLSLSFSFFSVILFDCVSHCLCLSVFLIFYLKAQRGFLLNRYFSQSAAKINPNFMANLFSYVFAEGLSNEQNRRYFVEKIAVVCAIRKRQVFWSWAKSWFNNLNLWDLC